MVTGGAGFIGSNLVKRLVDAGKDVIVIDNLSRGFPHNIPKQAAFLPVSIGSAELEKKLPPLIIGQSVSVIHLAAQIDVRNSVANPVDDARINIMESLKFLSLCSRLEVKKFIFASSGGAIYGKPNSIPTSEKDLEWPQNPYGVAKLAFEKYLYCHYQNFGLPYIALRLANVYGPMQDASGEAGVIAVFCRRMLTGESISIYGNGEQTRDFVYVGDVVEAFTRALNSKKTGIFNIGTGKETSINRIFAYLEKINGQDGIKPEYLPSKKGEQIRSCLEAKKAKKLLGWKPRVMINEGLKQTYEWFDRQAILAQND